ncbi:hypothetical protein G4H71_08770 [Rhodococcus triatomae]|uniref:GatB/YqeY domain-containing protein n=1 Tax=Rhodococcus triatomae TaxID=300028 RepID=A0A1G8I6Q5_9NOCA|nr:hypothetical protein [Rhodococcus triatomae]QNG20972.1 hypothetical protein G4H72_21615 [Rhodococcus triatomae]QNG23113.1 hypothetical protein G4H71_08770 [Rhodococcus triatomae]SDI14645.1 hypothetical protein SAMN05444695_105179 [Rhodococcus triatomae]
MTGPASPTDPEVLRSAMRADLVAAMKERRREVVAVLRTALAALDDAEAVAAPAAQSSPVAAPAAQSPVQGGHVAGARVGVGSTEVERRVLSLADVRAVLEAQIAERTVEAERYDTYGQHDAANRLRREAGVLGAYLGR